MEKPDWDSAQTPEDVVRLLKERHRHLKFCGFDDRGKLDIRLVREFGQAIHEMLTKYPLVEVTQVSITKPPPGMENTWAWATGWRTGKGYLTATIDLNVDMATSWEACNQQMQDEVRSNWAFGDPARPVYSSIIHEFGHAVDYATREGADARRAAHEQTKQVLKQLWQDTAPGVDYRTWVREQLSRYSFEDPNGEYDWIDPAELSPGEVLAEAFTDCELNGDDARDASKALHTMMVDALKTARGK